MTLCCPIIGALYCSPCPCSCSCHSLEKRNRPQNMKSCFPPSLQCGYQLRHTVFSGRGLLCGLPQGEIRRTILKGFICHLQEHALLRIHGLSLARSYGEKRSIEACNTTLEKMATFDASLGSVSSRTNYPLGSSLQFPSFRRWDDSTLERSISLGVLHSNYFALERGAPRSFPAMLHHPEGGSPCQLWQLWYQHPYYSNLSIEVVKSRVFRISSQPLVQLILVRFICATGLRIYTYTFLARDAIFRSPPMILKALWAWRLRPSQVFLFL